MAAANEGEEEIKVAVALQYEPGKDTAPRLTAKGHGDVAAKIVEIAEAAGVHVEHNEPLAKSLSQLDFGQQIPRSFTGRLPRWWVSYSERPGKSQIPHAGKPSCLGKFEAHLAIALGVVRPVLADLYE